MQEVLQAIDDPTGNVLRDTATGNVLYRTTLSGPHRNVGRHTGRVAGAPVYRILVVLATKPGLNSEQD